MKALMYFGCAVRFIVAMVAVTILFTILTPIVTFLIIKRIIKILFKIDHKYNTVTEFFKEKLPLLSEHTDRILFGFKEFIEV